jgi:hypothetical protein
MIFRSKKTDHTSKLDHTARELSEDELDLVSGGKRSHVDAEKFLEIKLQEVFVTSV